MATSSFGPGSSSVPVPAYHAPPIASKIPPGTFPPGTLITVGAHKCTIERYLSEGGFAHVYLVRLARPLNGSEVAVLKRVAVPDKEALTSMRTEVETMKRLKGHRHIVTYIDSHASHLKGGGYEVFLLMEYCSGGGLIDFMNTRLQNRLTEPEVLNIFSDIAEGVACMHYLQPPLLHRDLKVENVLIASSRRFVLCDFGSCAAPREAATTVAECRLIEEDIQKHTTLQYRSPEMIDVYRKLPIDEKSDIWALGVLLYKLCYYTTPFEEQGQLAILNASFKFPSYPMFSDRIKLLIASMLREAPQLRPNIYQVLREVCLMRGKEVPIRDIYSGKASRSRPAEKPVPSLPAKPSPGIVAYQSPVSQVQPTVPEIVPMRRGRPTKSPNSGSSAPQTRAVSSDPWAALDNRTVVPVAAQDEISARFPSVEQFSLLHDSGNKFDFKELTPVPDTPTTASPKDLSTRVMERLADDAFAQPVSSASQRSPAEIRTRETKPKDENRELPFRPVIYEPKPSRPNMISQGTMTSPHQSPCPSPEKTTTRLLDAPSRPQSRLLDHRDFPEKSPLAPPLHSKPHRPVYLEAHRSASYVTPRATSSSRPSLEAHRTASSAEVLQANPSRSKSANSKSRPNSVYIESNLDFLRDLDSPGNQAVVHLYSGNHAMQQALTGQSTTSQRSVNIESNVDFLRAMENESDLAKGGSKNERRISSGSSFVGKHVKRASMPSISLSNTKNLLAGKFGDAFRKFEQGNGSEMRDQSPSPSNDNYLMPTIGGSGPASEASDDNRPAWDYSSEELSPETKRELEKQILSQEEKRVAAAAAEYKNKLNRAAGTVETKPQRHGSSSRANLIQNKVKALLSENRAPTPRMAEGYGPYTNEMSQEQQRDPDHRQTLRMKPEKNNSLENSKAMYSEHSSLQQADSHVQLKPISNTVDIPRRKVLPDSQVQPPLASSPTKANAPQPPPKPKNLRTGVTDTPTSASSPTIAPNNRSNNLTSSPSLIHPPSKERLYPSSPAGTRPPSSSDYPDLMTAEEADDWQRTFAKRYPSLSGLELVETVVGVGNGSSSPSSRGRRV